MALMQPKKVWTGARIAVRLFAFLALGFIGLGQLAYAEEGALVPLTVERADGTRHDFMVELALTPEERAQGLMFRTELAPDKGMLFVFEDAERLNFWMRNTLIPLDMIFIRQNGRIANIIENAEPETDTPRGSKGRAIGVLELAGGRAAELGIKAGDLVRHPLLGTADDKAGDKAGDQKGGR